MRWSPRLSKLTDAELRAKTDEFRRRVQERLAQLQEPAEEEMDADRRKQWEKEQQRVIEEALDSILEEAFAVVREGGRRVLNMRHFDVQLIGGMVLHSGRIAEMKTGEGKTLVATLPVYLNSLSGRGVHVVTVNDYLAKRDSEWMGKLYSFLGLTVGVIVHDLDDAQRKAAYAMRHHLRNQQRIRLRLSARQHEVRREGLRAARAQLQHRRRSGFDPHRRSAYAADHQRSQRGIDRQVRAHQRHHSQAGGG